MASRVVVLQEKTPATLRAQAAWLAYVRRRQLTEALGWPPADPAYGGWGFSLEPPRKPKPGEPRERFFESNLSATVFGIAALRSARVPLDDPAWKAALVFVKRCQNFADDPARADARFDDGGFFFIPDDALQNKAGVAGRDRHGRVRFGSYGSMTADGVRALLQCGLKPDHPRVVAARRWLERTFSAAAHPGRFAPDREVLRGATTYYYAWAVAHAFARLGVIEARTKTGRVRWADQLADALLEGQRADGTWVNPYTDAKEDDPLVATPWAASALTICRQVLTTPHDLSGRTCPRLRGRAPTAHGLQPRP
jgi:squalene-hopene/tetraprenyl-beta-curcumene cyclase